MAKRKPEFTYEVRRTESPFGEFQIRKLIYGGVVKEIYNVKYGEDVNGEVTKCFCDCQGFLRQKYPKPLHKHILLVKDFLKRDVTVGLYRLDPTNKPIYQEPFKT